MFFTKIVNYETKINTDNKVLIGQIINYFIDGDKLAIEIKEKSTKEKIKVSYYFENLQEKENIISKILVGSTIKMEGQYSEPYANTIPNTFNYQQYLYNHQIYLIFNADDIQLDNKTNFFYNLKNQVLKRLNKSNSKDYLYAFILGETNYIDENVYNAYQNNGVTHLFAVSGLHIGILVLILNKIFIKFKRLFLKNLIITLILLFYCFLVGFSPSVLRGTFLYLFLLLNKNLNINIKSSYVIYLLFLIFVIINPFYVYDLGFIYSFAISFGLILFSSKIKGHYLKRIFITSSLAFLLSLPITIYNFYEINLLTILNNLIIVPIVSIIVFPLALITFIFPFLESVLFLSLQILEIISQNLNKISIFIVMPKINMFFVFIYYFIIYLIYKHGFKKVIYLIILIIIYKITIFLDFNNYIYFLDVGQGDATLFIGSNRQYSILIDTGGKITFSNELWQEKNKKYYQVENIIILLKSLGISKLDLLICTHGDYDHIGEAKYLVQNFKVSSVLFNNGAFNDLEKELIKELKSQKINYFQNIDYLKIKKLELYLLNKNLYTNENDNSIVIYTMIAKYQILLMGDAGIEVEKNILKNYNLSNIDILKVGHHGSNTSSSSKFINQITPLYSIISVGNNNRYNHPHIDILKNLSKSIIYRTDKNGSVKFKINTKKFEVSTYPP